MAILKVTSDNFEEVKNSKKTLLLDFWAVWCGPCQMVGPVVEEIAQDREDITVGKINVDDEVQLAIQFGVSSIPTLIVMEKGQIVNKAVGYRPKADIEKLL